MNFRIVLAALIAATFALLTPTMAAAEARQNFELLNNTGYTIQEVYVSPTTANDWQEDVLGQDELANDQSVNIRFHRSETACMWDLKVVYEDNTSAEWTNINLCTVSTITIDYDASTGRTWATTDAPTGDDSTADDYTAARQNFELENLTGYAISEVYVSPTTENDWQEDVLGQDELENRQSVNIRFHRSETSCHWDLKVVYDDGTSAHWNNFNLCSISEIEISYDRRTGKTWATWK